MALPTGTLATYASIGNREDLEDIIYDISPTDTPFVTNIGRGSASNVLHEWQTDQLAAASAANAQLEGDDNPTTTATATVRLANYAQILTKVPRVTGTQRAINTAGRRDELSYQISKRGRELKRDLESSATSNRAAVAGSALTARSMAGLGTFLWTNLVEKSVGGLATTVVVTSGAPTTAPTAGSAATFTQADLNSVIKQTWDEGGDASLIMLGSFNKQIASTFAGIGTQFRDVQPSPSAPGTIVGAADLFVSDFGTHQIVANRFSPAGNVSVLDLEYWEMSYVRSMQQETLSKTGDSDRRLILCEATLSAHEPDSSGKVYTVTTS